MPPVCQVGTEIKKSGTGGHYILCLSVPEAYILCFARYVNCRSLHFVHWWFTFVPIITNLSFFSQNCSLFLTLSNNLVGFSPKYIYLAKRSSSLLAHFFQEEFA